MLKNLSIIPFKASQIFTEYSYFILIAPPIIPFVILLCQ